MFGVRTGALAALFIVGSGAGAIAGVSPASAAGGTGWERPASSSGEGAVFRLDRQEMGRELNHAPGERSNAAPVRVSVPKPDGSLDEFEVFESPVMEPALAARHPEIKTYAGRSVDDATRTVRFDLGPLGLHASVLGGGAAYSVEPRSPGSSEHVIADDQEAPDTAARPLQDAIEALGAKPAPAGGHDDRRAGERVGLRTYRLALISDHTYADTVRDPDAPAGTGFRTTAAKVTLVNRLNQIFERDWAARLVLMDANDRLNLDTPALSTGTGGPCGDPGCYTEAQLTNCTSALIDQNVVVAGLIVGARNYDVGHIVMSRDTGGIARLSSVGGAPKAAGCSANKTRSVTKTWFLGVFAHELGHQFGAHHTWSQCSFGPPEDASAGVEPGGGATFMAYPGVCAPWNNVQGDREQYYSQHSLAEFHANATAERQPLNSQQNIRLRGFADGDSYRLTYAGGASAPITLAEQTLAGIKAAIEGIPGWPEGATVNPISVSANGLLVDFGGTLAGVQPEMLGVTDAVGTEPVIGERIAGGVQANGGRVELTGNHQPVVSAPPEATIPLRTPFALTGSGADGDGDALTYLWEQTDGSQNGSGSFDNVTRSAGPLFSVFSFQTHLPPDSPEFPETDDSRLKGFPTTEPKRSFPDVAQVVADNTNAGTGNCPSAPATVLTECRAEVLPTSAYTGTRGDRTMGFRLTARDNHPGAGGTAFADTLVRIDPAAGPFRVTSPATATTLQTGAAVPVAWSVAGTDRLADKVAIRLSLDGGTTFPIKLADKTANDGLAVVELPRHVLTTQGVLRVEAVGGVWFDLAHGLITIRDGALVPQKPSLSFGSTEVGHLGAKRDAEVHNVSNAPVTLGTVVLEGADAAAFSVTKDECSTQVLQPGKKCKVQLRFSPVHTGASVAGLAVPSDDVASPLRIVLTGEGKE